MFDSFYQPDDRDRREFGKHYTPPEKFNHGEWQVVARYPKRENGDGQPVEVDEMRLPARFFRIRALPSENSIGKPIPGFTMSTGSSRGSLVNSMAGAILDGMLTLDEKAGA